MKGLRQSYLERERLLFRFSLRRIRHGKKHFHTLIAGEKVIFGATHYMTQPLHSPFPSIACGVVYLSLRQQQQPQQGKGGQDRSGVLGSANLYLLDRRRRKRWFGGGEGGQPVRYEEKQPPLGGRGGGKTLAAVVVVRRKREREAADISC